MPTLLKEKKYEWEREREAGFKRTKRLDDEDDSKLYPDDIFDDNDVSFEENEGIVGWGKW